MTSTIARLAQPRTAIFLGSGAVSLYSSGILFKDLTDFSQWVMKPSRNSVWDTYQQRHNYATAWMAGSMVNTATQLIGRGPRPAPLWAWAGLNVTTAGLLFVGYFNNELMFRERNRNALFVSTCQATSILGAHDTVIVTQIDPSQEPVAFPDKQITRPHVARVGYKDPDTPVTMAYCGLTGTGIVYETPNLPCGSEREFFPLTQLENNLVVMDRTTGAIGHQINGVNETLLLKRMKEQDYDLVGRRPDDATLKELDVTPATEVPTWRMTVQNFSQAFPFGKIFINDYREFPDLLHKPVLSIYDQIINLVFWVFVQQIHEKIEAPLFPTVSHTDNRLPNKTRVWGFNVGDDHVAVTQEWVEKGKTRNFTVGGQPLVASWDPVTESVGIWKRASDKPIQNAIVNVHGELVNPASPGTKLSPQPFNQPLERLNTVKAGLFWFSWVNFFPKTRLNPEQ